MTSQELTDFLRSRIPLTAAMQLSVLRNTGRDIVLGAPLAPNVNLHDTVFGGSLVTLSIVAGWALLDQALRAEGIAAQLVVQKSECHYLLPAQADFVASASLPEGEWHAFLTALQRRGRGRIAIDVLLSSEGRDVARHKGSFVAVLDGEKP